ncbi:MAG: cadmium-translocating P-type ATPase [Clostridiales bacterium]|nr:cadmium-translocating P-type ATPase [Clostridiales bacterium]
MARHRKHIIKITSGAVIYALGIIWHPDNFYISLAIFLSAYIIIGGDVLLRAIRNIFRGEVFDENFLMSIATIGAFAIGEYTEGVAVMLFYQIGDLLQSYAVNKSRKSIAALMDIRPDYANVRRDTGDIERVDPDSLAVGDIIVIKPGERIPLDSTVIEGTSAIDTSALTGESLPRDVGAGDELLSGCININGVITARVTKEFGESTVNRILDLVENASSKKSNSENFITKFARYYTPAVVITAVLLAVLPPILIAGESFTEWIYRALIFLVISCPCALVISIPLSFFGGIGGASRQGILVKGSNYLEALASAETVVFDKTGTLTKGEFNVTSVTPHGITEDELLELVAHAEGYSSHPISQSLVKAYSGQIDLSRVSDVESIPGRGIMARVDGKQIAAGNAGLMEMLGISYHARTDGNLGTVVYVAVDMAFAGSILISDEIKQDAKKAISELRGAGVRKTVMLTGDTDVIGGRVAGELGIDKVYAGLLPDGKVARLEELIKEKSPRGKLVFIGDGINDAPVLARADIGIAMGGLGSDAAIEAADIVIMTDEPSKVASAIKISKKTLCIVKENIAIALGTKGAVLTLGAIGFASMWAAVFADVGVAIIAILNASRMLRVKTDK